MDPHIALGAAAGGERRAPTPRGAVRLYAGEAEDLLRRRATDGARLIVTPNLDHLRLLTRSRALRRAYAGADLALNDSRFLDRAFLGGRASCLPGSEVAPALLDRAAPGARVMVVGAPVAVRRWLAEAYPHLQVAALEPSFGYVARRAERRAIARAAVAFGPDLVLVCTGAPQSEVLGLQLKRALGGRACDILCCGAALHFLAGVRSRAPVWMRRIGAEWAWRFLREARTRGRYLADVAFLAVQGRALARLRAQGAAALPGYALLTRSAAAPER